MKIENEDALDNLIICKQCFTLHEEVPIEDGTKACCSECGAILYRYDSKLIEHGLALSITGFIFFVLANLFPLVQIEILGHEQFITIPKTIFSLFESEFYIVGLICIFLIFIFPLMIFTINILLFILLKMERHEKLTKELLILLSHIIPWSMTDIFLISILVALVKLIGYAQIHMGVSFWALIVFVLIDLYIVKRLNLSELWMLRKRAFATKDEE
ncbi:paraquat-inducible protein A [Sulfurovum sp.]|uniref:paraquat-inducible protein A n=1 Tax=Sulfurovum sp. TaxID=1969726 RepID=UPI003566CAB9